MLVVWSRAGLANRLHALINALYLQQKTNRVVYSCWPLNEHLQVPVHELFQYPLPLIEESIARDMLQAPLSHVCRFLETQRPITNVSVRTPLVLEEIPSSFIREVLKGVVWHPALLERVKVERLRYSLNDQTIGIHARGTDITSLTQLQIEVKKALYRIGSAKILICSDEPQVLGDIVSPRIVRTACGSRHTLEGMKQAVVDLLLLSGTKIRYYSPMSTYSWIAIALSNAPRRQVKGVLKELYQVV
jgi:hypothetical protein